MTHYTGTVPASSRRKTDWRLAAACRTEDPELFFPTGSEGGWKMVIAEAKRICSGCPVVNDCLRFAINENIQDGIFGGLTEEERRELSKLKGDARAHYIAGARQPITLASVFAEHTLAVADGHMEWLGGKQVCYAGVYYTPRRVAFEIARGEKPFGQVHPSCGRPDCVAPDHMADAYERRLRQLTEQAAA